MFLNLSTLALVLCVVGILLMRLEFPAVAGPVYASGAQERWGVKLLIPLLVIAGLGLPFFLEEDYGSLLCSTVPSTPFPTPSSAPSSAIGLWPKVP